LLFEKRLGFCKTNNGFDLMLACLTASLEVLGHFEYDNWQHFLIVNSDEVEPTANS
jgi:hypothetical protein